MKKTISQILTPLLLLVLFFTNFALIANPPLSIPAELQPWQGWVLKGYEEKLCPVPYNNGEEHICVWQTSLVLDLNAQNGQFTQNVANFKEAWIVLPGNNDFWPMDVKINDKNVPVVSHDGLPSALLSPGVYKIEGSFAYDKLPDFIQIPNQCGTLTLTLNSKVIDQPDRDLEGKIWIRRTIQKDQNTKSEDALSLRVFRLFDDLIPMQETTRLILRVSGEMREVSIGPVLQPKTVPLAIRSSLPARLEENGMLRLQLKPGLHTINVKSRYLEKMDSLAYIPKPLPWPKEEIWSFKPESALRLEEITGGESVDPEQAGVPNEFRRFPAYLMREGVTLTILEKRRGQVAHNSEQLSLHRKMWLDFSGKGFTLQDALTGTIEQHWRLLQTPPLKLENVTINGKAQLITQLTPQDAPGVEVREGLLDLVAMSTIKGHPFKLPAIGWDLDVQALSTTLILPPGWKLLGAWGVDYASNAWIQEWTLLDLFLVLIIGAATLKLLGLKWGIIAGLTLILIYQEPNAPIYSWLNVIAVFALLRVLPLGRAQTWSLWYFRASFVFLVIFAVPFMIYLVRTAIYPQLTYANSYQKVSQDKAMRREVMAKALPTTVPQAAMELMDAPGKAMSTLAGSNAFEGKIEKPSIPPLQDYSPNAKVQTGPGVPIWQWQVFNLEWNGPVLKDQKLTLWLLPSWATSLFKFLAVGLMAAFIFALARPLHRVEQSAKTPSGSARKGILSLLCCLSMALGLASFYPQNALAELPSDLLLDKLRDRLLEAPNCLPDCADISQLQVNVIQNQLSLRMRAQVLANTAVPIPSAFNKWMPRSVLVNNTLVSNLYCAPNGQLWVNLPTGVHDLLIEGPIGEQDKFELQVPLKPKSVDLIAQGWEVTGIQRHQLPGENIYFTRIKDLSKSNNTASGNFESGKIPSFVAYSRTLRLGQDWSVFNELKRIAPLQGTISVKLALLPGEQILSDKVQVREGNAFVSLAENEPSFTWQSKLNVTDKIVLTASPSPDIKEIWHLDAITRWHCTFEGIPLIHQNLQNRWFPTWQPWPSEVVTISIQRPEAVPGDTFTIDSSKLFVEQGRYASTNTFNFTTRATQGINHAIQIPVDAQLQDVLINGLSQPINAKNGEITLPISPGTQTIEVKWQDLKGQHMGYKTPLINLNAQSSNAVLEVLLSQNRWVLFLGGPAIGPAVLFWGILIVTFLVAIGLGRSKLTPLQTWQWFLLGTGLIVATPLSIIFVVAWFVALNYRGQMRMENRSQSFNWIQVGLACLTVAFVVSLFTSISEGLLGMPRMQIESPYVSFMSSFSYSDANYRLSWYQDLAQNNLPRAWIISLPLYVYRILMLLWALWLAFSLVKWLRWGWSCYSAQGYWQARNQK